MAYVKECPKCKKQMTEIAVHTHYSLVINSNGEIEGIREYKIRVIACKKCKYVEFQESERTIDLPVKLPKELIYAIAEELFSYVYHKL